MTKKKKPNKKAKRKVYKPKLIATLIIDFKMVTYEKA